MDLIGLLFLLLWGFLCWNLSTVARWGNMGVVRGTLAHLQGTP